MIFVGAMYEGLTTVYYQSIQGWLVDVFWKGVHTCSLLKMHPKSSPLE